MVSAVVEESGGAQRDATCVGDTSKGAEGRVEGCGAWSERTARAGGDARRSDANADVGANRAAKESSARRAEGSGCARNSLLRWTWT